MYVRQGDLSRGKISRLIQLRPEGPHPVTGLGYTITSRAIVLFVTTTDTVCAYHFRADNDVMEIVLDEHMGGALGCASLSGDGQSMIVARDAGVWEYRPDLNAGCQGFGGHKTLVACFRSYVAIASSESAEDRQQTLNLYDPSNKVRTRSQLWLLFS